MCPPLVSFFVAGIASCNAKTCAGMLPVFADLHKQVPATTTEVLPVFLP
jgi:hypothetical protein